MFCMLSHITFLSFNSMSGELGFYDTVVGNQGDRNDLDLWYKGGSLVCYVTSSLPAIYLPTTDLASL